MSRQDNEQDNGDLDRAEVDMHDVLQSTSAVHLNLPLNLPQEERAKLLGAAAPELVKAVIINHVIESMRPVLEQAKFEGEAIMRDALPPGTA